MVSFGLPYLLLRLQPTYQKCNPSVQAQREHIWIRWFRVDLILANGVDFANIAATAGAACGLCFAKSTGIRCVGADCWNQAFQSPVCDQGGVVIVVVVVVVVVATVVVVVVVLVTS